MATLVSIPEFRDWSGAAAATVPDELIQQCIDEAESALLVDVAVGVREIQHVPEAVPIATGDVMRRAANYLARRNSQEGRAGVGEEGTIPIPPGDPGSPVAVRRIKRCLGLPLVVIA